MATSEVSVALEGQASGAVVDFDAARRRPSVVPGYDPLEHVTPVPHRNTTEQPVYRGPAHFAPSTQTTPGEMTAPIDTNTFARQAEALRQAQAARQAASPLAPPARSPLAPPPRGLSPLAPPPRHAPPAPTQPSTHPPGGGLFDEEPTAFSIPPSTMLAADRNAPRPEPRTQRIPTVEAQPAQAPMPVRHAAPAPTPWSAPPPQASWPPPAAPPPAPAWQPPAPAWQPPAPNPPTPPPRLAAPAHGPPRPPAPRRPSPRPAAPVQPPRQPSWEDTGTFQADRYEEEAIKGSPVFLILAIGVVLAVIGAVLAFVFFT